MSSSCLLVPTPSAPGAVLPLLPPELFPVLPAHRLAAASNGTNRPVPGWRVGTRLCDEAGQARFKVAGRLLLPATPHAVYAPLLEALTEKLSGPAPLELYPAMRKGWAFGLITLSDKGAAGLREDASGPRMTTMVRETLPLCHEQGFMLPDDPEALRVLVMELALGQGYDCLLTSGGTGLSPRDRTPEALLPLLDRRLAGLEQAMIQAGLAHTPHAALSRPLAGTLGTTLILTLPGSERAVRENLAAVLPALGHGLDKLHGDTRDCGRSAS